MILQRLASEIEDPAQLEEAMERLHGKYSKKIVSEFTELQNSAANDLKEKSQLSEEEVNLFLFFARELLMIFIFFWLTVLYNIHDTHYTLDCHVSS